jgi:phosphatidyl-myo-inositol dimannoside synthase
LARWNLRPSGRLSSVQKGTVKNWPKGRLFPLQPVKSLLLAPELFAGEGGITRILRLYLKALCELAEKGDSVRFVSLNDSTVGSEELRRYSGSRLVEWEACGRSKPAYCRSALRMGLRSDRIVCGHIAQLPLAWAAAKLRPSLSYYLVAHGIEVWRKFTFIERRALKGARCIWCVSEYTRGQLLERCSIPRERTAIMPNALDPYLDPTSPVPVADGPPVVLTVSRISIADSYKGIEHLIQAMPVVRAEMPKARLRIVGRGDGLAGLQSLARGLSLGDAVEFAGYKSDLELREEFTRCRLFALPSQKEGFGLVYLEAMAHGRPCLGTHSGGTPEVITSDTGVLVNYGDVPAIAAAVVSSLRRLWRTEPILERAQFFSYLRFKERLVALLFA